jgi:hypothetical protein
MHRHRAYIVRNVEVVVLLLHLLVLHDLIRVILGVFGTDVPVGLEVGGQEFFGVSEELSYFGHSESFGIDFCTRGTGT